MEEKELETVRRLAHLAQIALTEEELARLAPELSRILGAFEVLARHAPPLPAVGLPPSSPRSRVDEPQPSLARDALLAASASTREGFFVVPKAVGGER